MLWTRLAPEPLAPHGGGCPRAVAVGWEIATDEGMRNVVRRGLAPALPDLAHSVHVEPTGLAPDREYWYRFRYGGDVSPVGRTRTTPAYGAAVSQLSFAFASCQSWDSGYYSAYRHLAEEDLDLVVHLGDYVYEGGVARDGGYRDTLVPRSLRPDCRTLDRWRLHALCKTDPDLQRAHARFPWVVTWDDHEVHNDYASGHVAVRGGHLRVAGQCLPGLLRAPAAAPFQHPPRRAHAAAPAAAVRRSVPVRRAGRPAVPERPTLRLGGGARLRCCLRPVGDDAR